MKAWYLKGMASLIARLLQWNLGVFCSFILWMGYVATKLTNLQYFIGLENESIKSEWKLLLNRCILLDWCMCSLYGIPVLMHLLRLVKQGQYVCIGKDGNRIAHEFSVSLSVEVTQWGVLFLLKIIPHSNFEMNSLPVRSGRAMTNL